jgi:hypothetical protein
VPDRRLCAAMLGRGSSRGAHVCDEHGLPPARHERDANRGDFVVDLVEVRQ